MLSKKTKYAIHALLKLAREKKRGPILISEISESENIPKKFLEAILLELRKAGILGSKMGKGGGYYLIREPEEVNLAEIVRLFDGAIALVPCATYQFYQKCDDCKDEVTCGLKWIMKDVRDATVEKLKTSTLQQIINQENKLKKKELKSSLKMKR